MKQSKTVDWSKHETGKAENDRRLANGVSNETFHEELALKRSTHKYNEVKPAGNEPWLNPKKARNKEELQRRLDKASEL